MTLCLIIFCWSKSRLPKMKTTVPKKICKRKQLLQYTLYYSINYHWLPSGAAATWSLTDKEVQTGILTISKESNQSNHILFYFLPAHLFLKQQGHAVHHLVPIKWSGCDVEEEAVEDGLGDPLQRNGQHEGRQANQDVGCQRGQTCFLHTDDTVGREKYCKNPSSHYTK